MSTPGALAARFIAIFNADAKPAMCNVIADHMRLHAADEVEDMDIDWADLRHPTLVAVMASGQRLRVKFDLYPERRAH